MLLKYYENFLFGSVLVTVKVLLRFFPPQKTVQVQLFSRCYVHRHEELINSDHDPYFDILRKSKHTICYLVMK